MVEIRGVLKAQKRYSDGTIENIFEEKNLITKQAKIDYLKYLYTPVLMSDPISNFKLGTGGALDPLGKFPKEPLSTQLDLNAPLPFTVATTAVPVAGEAGVTFLMDLDESLGNGQLITEAGLFFSSGRIFNVKNFPAIEKSPEFAIHFEWEVRIV